MWVAMFLLAGLAFKMLGRCLWCACRKNQRSQGSSFHNEMNQDITIKSCVVFYATRCAHITMGVHPIHVCIKEDDFKLLARYNTQPSTLTHLPRLKSPKSPPFLADPQSECSCARAANLDLIEVGSNLRQNNRFFPKKVVILLPQNISKPMAF